MWAVGRLSLLSRGLAIGRGLPEPQALPAVEAAAVQPVVVPPDAPAPEILPTVEETVPTALVEEAVAINVLPAVGALDEVGKVTAEPSLETPTPAAVAESVTGLQRIVEAHADVPVTELPERALVDALLVPEIPATPELEALPPQTDAIIDTSVADDLDCPSPDVDGWHSRSREADVPAETVTEMLPDVSPEVAPLIAGPEPLIEQTLTDLKPADVPRDVDTPAAPGPVPRSAPVPASSFFQRIVIKVKSFFRSLFR